MKKVILLFVCMIVAVTVFAQSYSGKSFTCNWDKGSSVSVMTLKFTSDTEGTLTTVTKFSNGKSLSKADNFTYQTNEGKLLITYDYGKTDVFTIENSNTLVYSIGNFKLTFKNKASSHTKKKSSSKKK